MNMVVSQILFVFRNLFVYSGNYGNRSRLIPHDALFPSIFEQSEGRCMSF